VPGRMQEWLTLFHERIAPLHEQFGLPVRTAWADHERSQFVWVREFIGSGSMKEQEDRYRASDERAQVIGDEPKKYITNMDIRTVEQAFPLQ
jgi:hypothetical protein